MTRMVGERVGELRTKMGGPVLEPGDPGYDAARRVWNAEIDKRPSVIAGCASSGDVVAAVRFAGERGLEVSVRGGAHNNSGMAACDDGMMIDLSRMNAVEVDPAARLARVGGGALLSDVDSATQAHGLAVPAGLVSHTGVGGLTLGGGMGWLTRKFGLTIDNLAGAEVVTADGRVLQATAQENPDLFWGIRGGGGNFGVATSFVFRLHEVHPAVEFGLFFWELEHGAQALRLARDVVTSMPPDVNAVVAALNAPPAPFVPEEHQLKPGYGLLLTGFGAADQHAKLVGEIRGSLPPLFHVATTMPYVELQQLLDEANAWGLHAYEKSTYVADLNDGVIDAVTQNAPEKSSPMSVLLFYRLDGAYSEVGDDETAFSGGRSPRYGAFIIALAPTSDLLAADRRWVRGLWDALQPHAIGTGDGYVNAISDYQKDRVRGSYGPATYERLARIKAEYDPDNLFHLNANIQPARMAHQHHLPPSAPA